MLTPYLFDRALPVDVEAPQEAQQRRAVEAKGLNLPRPGAQPWRVEHALTPCKKRAARRRPLSPLPGCVPSGADYRR
jgi:hypothetical protein